MADKEHLALLMQGVEVWNQWRLEHESIVPNLSNVDLNSSNLIRVNFRGANLSRANLSGASLIRADFIGANLSGANLSGANLIRANFIGANLSGANFSWANLILASLIGTNSSMANFNQANVSGVDFGEEDSREEDSREDEMSRYGSNLGISFGEETTLTDKPLRNIVQFTAYYPRDAKVNTRYSFLLYTHTKEAFEKVINDVEKFRDELGNKVPPPKTAKQTTQIRIDTPITIVLESEQIEFDPPSLTKKWGGNWTRFGFDFRPTKAMSNDTLFVRVSIQVATIEVAHINCAIEVNEEKMESPQYIVEAENPLAEAKLIGITSELYQTIFISYSRKDIDAVNVYKYVQESINIVFMDTDSIRVGEDWRATLAHAIDQADIFQLFWSENSAGSANVRDEWQYALKHKCPKNRCIGFIRPVSWNNPVKPSPPEELAHLHFTSVSHEKLIKLIHSVAKKQSFFSRLAFWHH